LFDGATATRVWKSVLTKKLVKYVIKDNTICTMGRSRPRLRSRQGRGKQLFTRGRNCNRQLPTLTEAFMKRLVFMLMALLIRNPAEAMQVPCVVSSKGYFRIHVGTGGLFGGFAHEHLIEADKVEGCATIKRGDLAHSSIKLAFSKLR